MKEPQHQAFLIAKVKPHGGAPARYRCVGAYEHAWCHGLLPVKAAYRTITLLKQQPNAQIVREELRTIDGKYGAFGEEGPKAPKLPCSYTTYLLHMASNVDYEKNSLGQSGYWFSMSMGTFENVLDASTKVWTTDTMSNEGVTIIDITDPTNPRYCFLPGCDSTDGTLDMTPLTAQQYLDTLINPERPSMFLTADHCREVSALLANVPLVSQRAIAEAWPAGPDDCFEYNETLAQAVEACTRGGDGVSSDGPPSDAASGMTVDPSIVNAVLTNNADAIAGILSEGDRELETLHAIRSIRGPFPDALLPIIAKILAAAPDTASNLFDIQLTGKQVLSVLPKGKSLAVVDLSGNAAFKQDDLRALVRKQRKTKFRIHRLVLVRTGVSKEDLIEMMNQPTVFSQIDEIIHPLLYSWCTGPSYPFSWGITFCRSLEVLRSRQSEMSAVPLMSLPQLVQSVHLLIDAVHDGKLNFGVGDAALDALTTAGAVPKGKAWGERPVWCAPAPRRATIATRRCWQFAIMQPYRVPIMHYGFMLYTPDRPGIVPNAENLTKITFMTVDDFLQQVKEDGYPPLSAEDNAVLRAACEKLESCGAKPFPKGAVNPDGTRATEFDSASPTSKIVGQMPEVDSVTAMVDRCHAQIVENRTEISPVHMLPRPMPLSTRWLSAFLIE
ncbi:hypothetical protein GGG16DRAFT_111366 [Schizophyllum commune]